MLKTNYRCQVDAQDKIISFSGKWSLFEGEKNGETILNSPILGHSIWDFIQGLSTRNIYSIIMKQVRETGRSICFPMRGDSPDMVRYMEMKVSLGEAGSIWFETSILEEMAKETVPSLSDCLPRQNTLLIHICAWCNVVEVAGQWVRLEVAIGALGLFDISEAPPITHGICPACAELLKQTIKKQHYSLERQNYRNVRYQISPAR